VVEGVCGAMGCSHVDSLDVVGCDAVFGDQGLGCGDSGVGEVAARVELDVDAVLLDGPLPGRE
jgi:hypothetical protein